MSHVDEGTLHAYLDGALEEYPALEARRVRDHLDTCPACRERLAAERGIRDEAASILALATPHVEAPTLEELRAYARAAATRRPLVGRRTQWLGWAASLVLALGTGWMLRGGEGGHRRDPHHPARQGVHHHEGYQRFLRQHRAHPHERSCPGHVGSRSDEDL